MLQDLIRELQSFTSSLPEIVQWLGVMVAAAIPFIESYTGSVLGVLVGINPVVAVLAAIVGNLVSMLVVVLGADGLRSRLGAGKGTKEPSPRAQKLRARFDRYGVAGVSLVGQTILPSQITSATMVSFGASRNAVVFWQAISITVWGTAFGALATLGVNLVG